MATEDNNGPNDQTKPSQAMTEFNSSSNPENEADQSKEADNKKDMTTENQVSLFILKAANGSLAPAETYLRNRGWIIGSATNLREALAYIIQKQPQFVMVTVDHPNKKVRVLPKLLIQAFPVRVFAFAEKAGPLTTKNFTDMGLEYNVYPPVSGPSIERMVLKMKKDIEQQAMSQKERPSISADSSQSDYITFKGENPQDAGAMLGGFEQARAALSQFVNSTDPESDEAIASGSSSGIVAGSISQKGPKTQSGMAYRGQLSANPTTGTTPSGPGYMPDTPNLEQDTATEGNSNIGYFPSHDSNPTAQQTRGNTSTDPNKPQPYLDQAESQPAAGESFSEWAERMRKTAPAPRKDSQPNAEVASEMTEPSNDSPESPALNQSQTANSGSSFPQGEKTEGKGWEDFKPNQAALKHSQLGGKSGTKYQKGSLTAPIMESSPLPKKKPKPKYRDPSHERITDRDSIFVKGTQQALDESSHTALDVETPDEVDRASNVACITVESARFSGYLVCALGKNKAIDSNFIDTIKSKLFDFLRANGEVVKEDDSMQLKIEQIEFEDWAIHQAEFLRKSIHGKDEVAVAFFPTKDLKPRIEDSASEQMVKLSIADLKPDAPLEFDLYMYMPENNKYLLYTPQGMVFYGRQKERLNEKGVTHMHLRKESANNVRRYKAQNFLNDKIQQYRNTKKSQ